MSSRISQGQCLCGAVAFEIAPPYRWFAYCHCAMCRKQHGALIGAGVGVERSRFNWLRGIDSVVPYRATASFERPFCRYCGAKVPGVSHLPDVIVVPAGLVDDLDAVPRSHIFVGSKSGLWDLDGSLRRFAAYPPSVELPDAAAPAAPSRPGRVVGGCLCGVVRYVIRGKLGRLVHCHGPLCRRSRGGPHASTVRVPATRFEWTRGEDALVAYDHVIAPPPSYSTSTSSSATSGSARRMYRVAFCERCGSLMPVVDDVGGAVDVPAGGLDEPLEPLPAVHAYVARKVGWDRVADDLPCFDAEPQPASGTAERLK